MKRYHKEDCALCGKPVIGARKGTQGYCHECHALKQKEFRAQEKKTKQQLQAQVIDLKNRIEELEQQLKQQQNGRQQTPP